jgi:hypothetical protein
MPWPEAGWQRWRTPTTALPQLRPEGVLVARKDVRFL